MPGGDGTGPLGMGPMTGRAAGFCAGYEMHGCASPMGGRMMGRPFGPGMGWGRGRGRGRRNWFYATELAGRQRMAPVAPVPNSEQELDALKAQAEYFGGALEDIKSRIAELESGKKGK